MQLHQAEEGARSIISKPNGLANAAVDPDSDSNVAFGIEDVSLPNLATISDSSTSETEGDDNEHDNGANLFSNVGDDVDEGLECEEVDWSNVSSFVKRTSVLPSAKSWDLLQDMLHTAQDVNNVINREISPEAPYVALFDSGCTCHISPYCEHFTSVVKIPLKAFCAANKQQFSAIGIGELTIDIPNGMDTTKLCLTKVLYSPEVGYTLISISKLDNLEYSLLFGDRKCTIHAPNGNVVGEVLKAKSGLYRIVHEVNSAQAAMEMVSLNRFHHCIGHIVPETA